MILDSLSNASLYAGLGSRIAAAFAFLRQPQTVALEPAALGSHNSLRIDICGDDVFALVQRYETKLPTDTFWEAHRKYIDVQCVVEGIEMMNHAPLDSMRIVQPYDEEKDFMKLSPRENNAEPHVLRVAAGMFAIFMPHDAHMPGLAMNGVSSMVKKIVVKVRTG